MRLCLLCPLLSLPFLGCGSTGRALTTDAGMEAAAPYEGGVDAGYDAPHDAPIEAAQIRKTKSQWRMRTTKPPRVCRCYVAAFQSAHNALTVCECIFFLWAIRPSVTK